MSLCEVRPQALQQIGGIASEEAIVPDIQGCYSFGADLQGCKRYSCSDSDCLSIGEEELELLSGGHQQFNSFSFPEPKRHCGYNISPEQFQLVENISSVTVGKGTFTLEVKDTYNFGVNKDDIFNCGGNSPVCSSSSSVADFTPTSTQTSADCQQVFDLQTFVPADLFPNMQHKSQTVLSHPVTQHSEKYDLVITEQPEEVSLAFI